MRKLLLIGTLALIAAAAFAQTAAPAPTTFEIYGSTFFDYQMSGTEWAWATPGLADFTFSKLRFGFRAQLNDSVKSFFEFDPRNAEFRLAYIDWTAMPGLTITAGKTFTDFQQIVAIYGAGRNYLVGAKYAIAGLGWINLQVGNKSDLGFLSGNYLIFPQPTASSNTGVNVVQDPWLYVWPAIVAKPDLGPDLSLEVGVESQMRPQLIGAANPTALDLDAYFTIAAAGFTFTNEFTYFNINDSNTANQELTYYAQLTYTAGMVAPTVYLVTDTKKDFTNNPNTAIGIELPITVAKNFVINPLFSYAISNYNAFEGNNAIVKNFYNKNDWTFGVRFSYSYSQKF